MADAGQRCHRRRGGIRYRRGRRVDESDRPDGARHPSRSGRCRAGPARRGRRVLRLHRRRARRRCRWWNISACRTPIPIPPSSAARRSKSMSRTRTPHWKPGCARRGDRLWQHAAHRRAAPGQRARIQPVRDAVPPVPARHRLCDGGVAPHVRIRHHARANGRGRGGGARMGAAQPGGVGEEAADRSPTC